MKKRVLFIAVGVVVVFAALAVLYAVPRPQTATGFAMGSVLTQTYWGEGPADAVTSAIHGLEQELTSGIDDVPALAEEIRRASGGAFDPCLGALVKLWNINSKPYLPTREEIEQALQEHEADLGAYGKGAACDKALHIIAGKAKAAVLNLGGNILTYGQKPRGKPFKIALRDPKGGPNDTMGVFTLKGTYFISTSGSYEKYFERDGKRYHHIFDPATGYPAEREPGLISVTVVSREGDAPGALGDALSTACFVLGYRESLALLAKYGCDALFIYEDGEVCATGDAKAYFTLDGQAYHWGGV